MKDRVIWDGRFIIVLVLIFYFGGLWLVSSFTDSRHAWRRFGVASEAPSFLDMRFVVWVIESKRAGYDPYRKNPPDRHLRLMNYPRLWLSLSALGLKERHTVPLAVGLALVFYLSAFLLVGRLTPREGAFYSLLLCSPAGMLGIERGNVDLLIFSLLTLAVVLIRKQGTRSLWPYTVVMVCSWLKLYPIFAMTVALRNRSRTVALSIMGGAGAIFLTYLLWIRSDLTAIVANTRQGFLLSFGSQVVFLRLASWIGPINIMAWSVACLAGVIAIAIAVVKRTSTPVFSNETAESMLIGMSIYVGIFTFLNNINYKLVFLIFAVPQVLQWIRFRNSYRTFAYLFLATMALAFWMSGQLNYPQFLLKELMNWSLFGMSTVLLLHFLFASAVRQASLNPT